jgi:hypothetical protein
MKKYADLIKTGLTPIFVATFNADTTDLALTFTEQLSASSPHRFSVCEPTNDRFNLYWIKDHAADGDYGTVVDMLRKLDIDTLRMQAIVNFKVEETHK